MKTRLRWSLHRILVFLIPHKGIKRPRLRTLPEGGSYVAAGAYPIRRAVRLP